MNVTNVDRQTVTLCADGRRSRRALLHAIVLPTIALLIMLVAIKPDGHWSAAAVLLGLVTFNLYALAYVRLTWRVFARVDAATFTARMDARRARRRPRMERLLPSGDGPSFAITASLTAFAVVLVIPHIEAIRVEDWLLVTVSLTILLACWGLSVLSYALHYAQHDLADPALDFAGERTGAFQDYLYFAIGVATTFGATDVTVTRPQMRRIVNFNVVVAFLFNSVVVALLASILIR